MLDRYLVETPEQIDVAYDIAGIGSRFLAAIIDTLIILLIEGVLLFVLSLVASQLAVADSIVTAIGIVVTFVVLWGYYLTAEMLSNGQSPGKRLVGVRVVREGGRPVTFTASAIRNVIRVIDFLPLFYGIGVVAMFIDQRARRLGDLAAGTLVVRERSPVTLESLSATGYAELPAGQAPVLAHIERLSDDDYLLLQEFLRRRDELSSESRQRIAAQLADGLRARLEAQPAEPAETFLVAVASGYAAHRRASTLEPGPDGN